ncbi:FGGY family carbohydrate kinase [Rathayibacter sp. VKM Ac-2630]|uniref:FGGY family carbohydrate kinase n=1 Tax=Rathayibacter sp. VKM Ac-2630 TaxID=1938617 RepID=UPI003157FC26
MKAVAAVDLGATSGRVILGYVGHDELRMRHVARFPNQPVRTHEGDSSALHWNILELYRSLTAGLTNALREEPEVVSIGVDSWAVDYALLRQGRMLGAPYHYRDERTARGVADVHSRIGAEELYQRSGLQHLPFNTLFQLAAERDVLALADQALLVPDLIGYWLTGVAATEITNASTTGLLSPHTRAWDDDLLTRLDLPRGILAPLIEPGSRLGSLLPSVAADLARRRAWASSPSAPTTRPRPSSRCPRPTTTWRTSRAEPGRSSASNSRSRWSRWRVGPPTSPTRAASTGASAT